MNAIYTLTVRQSVNVPSGTSHLDIGHERTFYFPTIEERQEVIDWARKMRWRYSTNIEFVTDAASVMEEIRKNVRSTCDQFGVPVPEGVE